MQLFGEKKMRLSCTNDRYHILATYKSTGKSPQPITTLARYEREDGTMEAEHFAFSPAFDEESFDDVEGIIETRFYSIEDKSMICFAFKDALIFPYNEEMVKTKKSILTIMDKYSIKEGSQPIVNETNISDDDIPF